MTLAARCEHCGTLFRVMRDQLWVSGGWVRCGRCSTAFNAFDQLYDLTKGKPPPWQPRPPLLHEASTVQAAIEGADGAAQPDGATSVATAPGVDTSREYGAAEREAVGDDAVAADTVAAWTCDAMSGAIAAPGSDAPVPVHDDGPAPEPSASQKSDEPVRVEAGDLPVVADATIDEPRNVSTATVDGESALPLRAAPLGVAAATPEFLRRAEKQARWQRPQVRLALGAAALLALALLVVQAGLHFRHGLAAESPLARAALGWLCDRIGCRIEAPRRIDELTVESSSLTRVGNDERLIRLSLTLRNRSRVPLAVPALDLSLKDGSGNLLVRRAIRPQELPSAPPSLPPRSDVPLQLLVATDGRRIASYTVEIFYP